MAWTLIVIGWVCLATGLLWPWLAQLPLGPLPGDVIIRREGFTVCFPITTLVLINLFLSLVLCLFGR